MAPNVRHNSWSTPALEPWREGTVWPDYMARLGEEETVGVVTAGWATGRRALAALAAVPLFEPPWV